jgi:hypothetical protein
MLYAIDGCVYAPSSLTQPHYPTYLKIMESLPVGDVSCAQNTHTHTKREKQCIGAVNVMQGYVWMGISRAVTLDFFAYIQEVRFIR